MIYYGIFSSIQTYAAQIWGQIQSKHVNRIIKLQDRAIRIINFAKYCDSRNPLCHKSNILNFNDNLNLQNFLLVYDSLKGNLPSALNKTFTFVRDMHEHNTRSSVLNQVTLPKVKTQIYGLKSVIYQAGSFWNSIMKIYTQTNFLKKTKYFCKKVITKHLLENYNIIPTY